MLAGVLAGVLTGVLASVLAGVLAGVLPGMAAANAALGVFLRFEVLDFDFLSFLLCHFSFLSGWFRLCQWHRRAIDARL